MMLSIPIILSPLLFLCSAESDNPTSEELLETPGWDLSTYVSRPDLRPPILHVERYEADAVTPGYIFTSPYGSLTPATFGHEFVPYEAGPHIYDHRGELVWSGGSLIENRNTYDFKPTIINGSSGMTFILDRTRAKTNNLAPQPQGVLLDDSYQVIGQVDISQMYNMHEFNVVPGNVVIRMLQNVSEVDISERGYNGQTAKIGNNGFEEIDLATNQVTFQWNPYEHIPLSEVMVKEPGDIVHDVGWDCYHTNSVDKFENGDYLISVRHTDTIYRLSGKDGHIIWRLGGIKAARSDFKSDFNFSSQHHARIHTYNQNSGKLVISFHDNASDDRGRQNDTALASTAKIAEIDEHANPKTAKLLKEFVRPDGKLTNKRGSAQILSNDNVFVSWSDHGYLTEFTAQGRSVFEARYAGERFDTYRAYKSDSFVGRPVEVPALKTFANGPNKARSSISYVSWNGATEVVTWVFYGTTEIEKDFVQLGRTPKVGFETSFVANDFWAYTFAEAFDREGNSLGKSEVQETILPNAENGTFAHDFKKWTDVKADLKGVGRVWKLTAQVSKPVGVVSSLIITGSIMWTIVSVALCVLRQFRKSRRSADYLPIHHNGEHAANALEMASLTKEFDADDEKDEARDRLKAADRHGSFEVARTMMHSTSASGNKHMRHRSKASISRLDVVGE